MTKRILVRSESFNKPHMLDNNILSTIYAGEEIGSLEDGYKPNEGIEDSTFALIDTLFNHIDTSRCGTIWKQDIIDSLKRINDKELIETVRELFEDDEKITKTSFYEVLFESKELTYSGQFLLFILIWILPIFYSASTRLPFISVALEITDARNGELWQVGAVLGVYQTCRSLANFIISRFGGSNPIYSMHLPMLTVALFAWLYSAVSTQNLSDDNGSVWKLLVLGGVGMGEVVVTLQTALIHETRNEYPSKIAEPQTLLKRLRMQYAAISTGSFLAYVIGGLLFNHLGFESICYLGVSCQVMQIFFTIVYFMISNKSDVGKNSSSGSNLLKSIVYRFQAFEVLQEKASNAFEGDLLLEEKGIADALSYSKKNRILQHSLKQLYNAFFNDRNKVHNHQDTNSRPKLRQRKSTYHAKSFINIFDSFTATEGDVSFVSDVEQLDMAKVIMRLFDYDQNGKINEQEFVSYLAPRVFRSFYGSLHDNSVQVVWPYMKIIVLTQAVMALCIGTFLSTSLLLYTQKFGKHTSIIGLIFGTGEGLGALVLYLSGMLKKRSIDVKANESKVAFFNILISRPLNIPIALLILSSATMGFSCNNFGLAVIFHMVMSIFNDLSVSFINELLATSLPADKFMYYQGLGQWLRRLGNMLTAFTGPVLLSIYIDLPFLLFGGIVFFWALLVWFFLYRHAKKITQNENLKSVIEGDDAFRSKSGPVSVFLPTLIKPWNSLESLYYVSHKEEINKKYSSDKVNSCDIDIMNQRIRKLNAALRAESVMRKKLELHLNNESNKRKNLESQVETLIKNFNASNNKGEKEWWCAVTPDKKGEQNGLDFDLSDDEEMQETRDSVPR